MRKSPLVVLALLWVMSASARASVTRTVPVRIGYFPNLTHAQALVGRSTGRFERALAPEASIRWLQFNAGPSVIEALFAGQIDLAYIGPGPTLTGFIRSEGKALRVIAGAADGGAGLVARKGKGVRSVADLAGHRVASPQAGNTQDIALRHALKRAGLAPREQGGAVWVVPMANHDIRTLFLKGELDAAWVPEPWLSLLIHDAGGELVLDERSLWPEGHFVTTHLIASTRFLSEHRDLARRFLREHMELTGWIEAHPLEAKRELNVALASETGKRMNEAVLDAAWSRVRFTTDPIRSSLEEGARRAFELGFLGKKAPDLRNLYDLSLLETIR